MTRSITYGLLFIMLAGLVITACGECPDPPDDAFVTDLLAGQTLDVGNVTIWNNATHLFVLYEVTEEGWYLTETHLDVECDWDMIPHTVSKNGDVNPIPGHFEYSDSFEPSEYQTSWCQVIEKPDCIECGEELAVAAHAVVVHITDGCLDIYSDSSTQVVDSYSPINDPLVNDGKNFAVYPFDAVAAWEHPNWGTTKAQFSGPADWIWESEYVQHPVAGDIVYFEKTFSIPGIYLIGASGTMRITCDNGYEFFVNAGSQGSAQVMLDWRASNLNETYVQTSGWQSYEDFTAFGDDLVIGSNTLRFETANEEMSQASGDHGSDGTTTSNPGALIFAGEVCYTVVDQEETAWANGTRFNTRGNWGMWYGYDWLCFADLELTKTITTEPPYAVGDEITWVVNVTNKGPDTALDVIVTDYLPDTSLVEIDSITPSVGIFDGSTGEWDIGDIDSGEYETLTIITTITNRGAIINSAQVNESGSFDPDSTPGNYDPSDHAGTDEDDSDVASIIFFPVAGNAYIGYEDRASNADFDYNDFGMNMELTEAYKNGYLSSIDMNFTAVINRAGDVHDIHIERPISGDFTYEITRSGPKYGTEDAAGSYPGAGTLNVIIFDTARWPNTATQVMGQWIEIHVDIPEGNTANPYIEPSSLTPPRIFSWGYDLDPVFAYYDPYLIDRSTGNTKRDISNILPAVGPLPGPYGYQVPFIIVVPVENWPAPGEGVTITGPYPNFSLYYRTGSPSGWYV